MNRLALKAAGVALERALQAHLEMAKATSLEKLELSWSDFLTSSQRIYSKLSAGSKKNINSKLWMADKKQFQEKDPLLKYLLEARNTDEHYFTEVIQTNGVHLIIGSPGKTVSPEGPFVARELGDGIVVTKTDLVVKLVPVKGRENEPPQPGDDRARFRGCRHRARQKHTG